MSVVPFRSPATSAGVVAFDRLMAEAIALAEDARVYLINKPKPRVDGPTGIVGSLAESAEIGRVTSRVGYCVAWLLARQAVSAGEIGEEEGRSPQWRLTGDEVCGAGDDDLSQSLSPVLRRLAERSLNLYQRIERLDRQLDSVAS